MRYTVQFKDENLMSWSYDFNTVKECVEAIKKELLFKSQRFNIYKILPGCNRPLRLSRYYLKKEHGTLEVYRQRYLKYDGYYDNGYGETGE